MKLFAFVNTIYGIWRYGADAFGANVLTTRWMLFGGLASWREVLLVFGVEDAMMALIGDFGAVQANETVRCLLKRSAFRYDTTAFDTSEAILVKVFSLVDVVLDAIRYGVAANEALGRVVAMATLTLKGAVGLGVEALAS